MVVETRMRAPLQALPLLLALALAAACGGAPEPVAGLEVELARKELPHRSYLPLQLAWRLREPLTATGALRVFVHLIDPEGSVARTFDHPWPHEWRPGSRVEYVVLLHQSALAPPLEPGGYGLTVGLYDEAGERWPLATRGETVDRYEYRVAELIVPPGAGQQPLYQFSSEWLAPEAGRDRQILTRRWLGGPGHLRAAGVLRPGELWLRLRLPQPGERQQLVLGEGASQQGVVIRSDCGGVEVRLAGAGEHDVVLPIAASGATAGGPEEGSCAIHLEPNFYLRELDSLSRRALSLEVLAWAPAPD